MYDQINLNTIGTDYKVNDKAGNLIKHIHVVDHKDILSVALGEFSDEYYADMDEYLSDSIANLNGFAKFNTTLWHTCYKHDFDLEEVIKESIKGGYDKVIVEMLEFGD